MSEKDQEEIARWKENCTMLEDQIKLLVTTELNLRRTRAEVFQAKKVIEVYNKTLEKKVQERTLELEKVNKELTEFTYIVSHDLQEPLRKINTFGERIKSDYKDLSEEQLKDYINRMQNASTRMRALITDLLDYSRVTTRQKPFETVDLNQVIKDVISDLEIRIENTKGLVEIGELINIDADATQMHQLFLNLIGNALKFHKPNESPHIKVYQSDVKKDMCTIIVEDNGIGIGKSNYEKVFGVFQRLHGKNEYEGNGIGLSVCKKIVDRHGGKIAIDSEVGKGTKFIISLKINNKSIE